MTIIMETKTISQVLNALNNPQKAYPIVHIAGTNGKGSVASYLMSILKFSSYKVGGYKSPSFLVPGDGITVDLVPISKYGFYYKIVNDIQQKLLKEKTISRLLTKFEEQTVVAYLYFSDQRVDIAVIECGMGGITDATNVKPINKKVCILTNIGLDHQEHLGATLEAIAAHKSGIVPPKVPVVIAPQTHQEVTELLEKHLKSIGCPVLVTVPNQELKELNGVTFAQYRPDSASVVEDDQENDFTVVDYRRKPKKVIEDLSPFVYQHMSGRLHEENVATVINALRFLMTEFKKISINAIRKGLAVTRVPGRMTLYPETETTKETLVDGAHNVDAIKYLRESLKGRKSIHFVFAFSETKAVFDILNEILTLDAEMTFDVTGFTTPSDMPWVKAYNPEKIKEHLVELGVDESKISVIESLKDRHIFDFNVITGSLYLVSDFYRQ
jgi:dihydrofolate synthase/folylpolyglutamate synthase